MKSLLSTIVERIYTMGRGNNSDVIHIEEVTSVIAKLKRGKRDGTHKKKFDHIIGASAKIHVRLTTLINNMIINGYWSQQLLQPSIVPIPKDGRGSLSCSENSRGIALSNCIL